MHNLSSPLPRALVYHLLQAALATGEVRFARQAALAWLAAYPGDLEIACLHAQALLREARQEPASRRARRYDNSIALLRSICLADPEFLSAQELLAQALWEAHRTEANQSESSGLGNGAKNFTLSQATPSISFPFGRAETDTFGDVLALGGRLPPQITAPEWGTTLHQARLALDELEGEANQRQKKGAWRASLAMEAGQRQAYESLLYHPTTPLAAVTHMRYELKRALPLPSLRSLAEMYHERWPGCVPFTLILASACMEGGEAELAVSLLHQAVASDITGQVARRLWGENHPYRALWPDLLEAPILQELAIPAAVAATLGWNQLPAGQERAEAPSKACPLPQKKETHLPETPISIQVEFERIAARLKQPHIGRMDGRFPVYVIFTTRCGLQAQYGAEGAQQIEAGMLKLVEAVRSRQGWDARLFYADEGLVLPTSAPLISLRQTPARCGDAWSLKLALADLDAALGKAGEMIGAVLIVGGPEVVPFHHLPNPLDDTDADVPSDNPYSSRDENYFIPEWPVGRLPGGAGGDARLLLSSLADFAVRHQEAVRRRPFFVRWWRALRAVWPGGNGRLHPSLGYTAEIWKRASQAVFRPANAGRPMLVSPPVQACEAGAEAAGSIRASVRRAAEGNRTQAAVRLRLHPARLGYFNLHGLPDTVEWFGQRDPASPLNSPDYPVALRPADLSGNNGNGRGNHNPVPQVVFSEACYGAHILGKQIEEALALKFLAAGSQAFVGSTCIAYGAIADPLTAADLLGHAFWSHLRQGLPAGEALRRAKIYLAREMHRRQGYLDGEDQKTLISFVLYGDPLAQPMHSGRGPKTILRSIHPPAQVKTVCDRAEADEAQATAALSDPDSPIPADILQAVKSVVEVYLPGMAGAQARLSHEHAGCRGVDHCCPTSQMGAKGRPTHEPRRQVVTLQKTIPTPDGDVTRLHRHYARLTLDKTGKLVKLAVSR